MTKQDELLEHARNIIMNTDRDLQSAAWKLAADRWLEEVGVAVRTSAEESWFEMDTMSGNPIGNLHEAWLKFGRDVLDYFTKVAPQLMRWLPWVILVIWGIFG